MPAMARRRVAALAMLTRCVTALLPLQGPSARARRAGLRAAPQKYDETTAPLAATLRSSEFAATAATLSGKRSRRVLDWQ